MEYKLSKSEFYRIGYLLAGLFMFLFLFGILSLSSFAKTTSINLKSASSRPTSFDGSCTVTFGTPSFTVNIPADSGLAQGQNKTFYYTTNLYVTTTAGTFLLRTDNYNFTAMVYPSQVNTFTSDLHMSGIGSFELAGQFISADLVLDSDDPIDYYTFNGTEYGNVTQGSYGSTYRGDLYGGIRSEMKGFGISSVNSNFVSVSSSSLSGSAMGFDFSDYSSYSPVSIISSFSSTSAYGDRPYSVGHIYNFSFPDYEGTDSAFQNAWIFINNSQSTQYTYSFAFSSNTYFTSVPNITLYVRDPDNNPIHTLNFSLTNVGGTVIGDYHYYCSVSFTLENPGIYQLLIQGSYPTTIISPAYSLVAYKATIADYMQYVKENWNDISPSVTTTNQNIAQSQSDISTAQTFESGAFSDFDTSMSNSGLDQFSLSFNSTPLFWCASIINTFYNNMPVGFQYLLAFVAFIGILCTVLNVFGRVAQRFGDRDSSSLNKHDVFAKIEKHGSI